MRNSRLITILAWAYHLTNSNYQIVPGHWDKNLWDSYDVEAIAAGASTDDDLRRMFQTLLADRFKLKIHRETRELLAYDLLVSHSGPKLTPAPKRSAKISIGFGGSSTWVEFAGNGGLRLVGQGASTEELAVVLTGKMHAAVRDRTGLTGAFDYNLTFSSGLDASEAPTLTTAIRQLGLNLKKTKGEFEVVVIDHVEKPLAN